jgi:hypothetical protein
MSAITQETATEQRAIVLIHQRLERALETHELDVEFVAERLGLVPEGVRSLLLRRWTFETAFRVAQAMDFDFTKAIQRD